MSDKDRALHYHKHPQPGKLATYITKPLANQDDLSLAYSPGVAEPVLAIDEHPEAAYDYTSKGNLVGVISNGTAILGLGNLGALASKPVMEGKVALFKVLAGVDAYDIEVDEKDPEAFIAAVRAIAPTFGAINLEDIKAPDCFEIEQKLQAQLDIPVFHDDQHGTAITMCAGLINAIHIQEKNPETLKVVIYGAGAAAIACCKLMPSFGIQANNIALVDRQGVIYQGREGLTTHKAEVAIDTPHRTLQDICKGADVIIDLAGALIPEPKALLESLAPKAICFMLSNPTPAIDLDLIRKLLPDAIVASGRSDQPNQINNAVCFPHLFRGALDVRASQINLAMQKAAAIAIGALAQANIPESLVAQYPYLQDKSFGANYIIPKITDPRLKETVAKAVAEAAIATGVAYIK